LGFLPVRRFFATPSFANQRTSPIGIISGDKTDFIGTWGDHIADFIDAISKQTNDFIGLLGWLIHTRFPIIAFDHIRALMKVQLISPLVLDSRSVLSR